MSVPVVKVSVLTTPPALKIKVLPKPVVQVRLLSQFPSSVTVLSPVLLDRTGGNYQFSLDLNAINDSIGNAFQPLDSDLTAIAALTTTTYGRSLLTLANATALAAEVDSFFLTPAEGNAAYQPLDSDLTAIAALTTTSYGRAFLALADVAAARTAIGVGTIATQNSNNVTITGGSISGITDLAIADGGTGASTAATARTNLGSTTVGDAVYIAANAAAARTAIGAVIGTDVQAFDSDLSALAANATNGIWARTGAGTGSARTITGTANAIAVTNGDGVSGNPTLAISTDAALPGNPTTTTQALNNNSTRVSTTAFFFNQVSNATPLGSLATGTGGTSTLWARADHVHPGREVLTANRTYYFRGDGSDSNTGLVNSAGGAFLTIQKAIDTVAGLDCSIYDVTIQGGATGTYAPITLKTFLGSGKATIVGDTTTPANYVIASTSADGVGGSNVLGRYKIEGFKFTNATSGSHIKIFNTYLELGANDYGAATTAHIWTEQNAYVEVTANYTISGGATRHLFATTGGIIVCTGKTVTLTGTPAFSSATIIASRTGVFVLSGNTYSGAATGTRYVISFNAIADVAGGGASYIPGNAAGSTATGGQYA